MVAGATNPAYSSAAPRAIPTALPAAPSPARPLPAAATAIPAMIRPFASGRRLKERYALLWIFTGVVLVILSAWRGGLTTLAGWFGVATYPPAWGPPRAPFIFRARPATPWQRVER